MPMRSMFACCHRHSESIPARIRGQIAAQRVQTVTLALRVKQVRAKLHVPCVSLRHGELRAVQPVPQRFAIVDDGGVRGEVGCEGAEQILRSAPGVSRSPPSAA